MSGASSQLAAFNYAVQPLGNLQIKNITAAYTVLPSDSNFILNCTGATSYTIAMPSASSLPSGFNFIIWNNTTTTAMAVTIDPNGAETIDGRTTLVLNQGEGVQVVCNGLSWNSGNQKLAQSFANNFDISGTRPVASGLRTVAIGSGSTASGTLSHAFGYLCNASNTSASAFGYSASASGSYSLAISGTASAQYSTAIGQNSGLSGAQAVTGAGAMALGGSYASGTDSFAAAVANNTSSYGATGANSVALGNQAKASASNTFAFGNSAAASGGDGAFSAGSATTASLGSFATGYLCNATGSYSQAIGFGATSGGIYGKFAKQGGYFAGFGDAQFGILILRRATTDATATVLTSDNAAASTTNQVILPNNAAYAFTGTVVARRQAAGGTESAAWKVEGLIRREANAGTTTLVASTVTAISNVPAWTLALTADTTNGGLAVTATGAAATNIRWVANIQTSEVTYA